MLKDAVILLQMSHKPALSSYIYSRNMLPQIRAFAMQFLADAPENLIVDPPAHSIDALVPNTLSSNLSAELVEVENPSLVPSSAASAPHEFAHMLSNSQQLPLSSRDLSSVSGVSSPPPLGYISASMDLHEMGPTVQSSLPSRMTHGIVSATPSSMARGSGLYVDKYILVMSVPSLFLPWCQAALKTSTCQAAIQERT